jgi:hypothetical protein
MDGATAIDFDKIDKAPEEKAGPAWLLTAYQYTAVHTHRVIR